MKTKVYYANIRKLIVMIVLAAAASAAYMLLDVNFGNERLFAYALHIRTPKLIVMVITGLVAEWIIKRRNRKGGDES